MIEKNRSKRRATKSAGGGARKKIKKLNVPAPGDVFPFSPRLSRSGAPFRKRSAERH